MEYCGLYFCLVAKTKQKEIADKKCEHIYNGYIKQPVMRLSETFYLPFFQIYFQNKIVISEFLQEK